MNEEMSDQINEPMKEQMEEEEKEKENEMSIEKKLFMSLDEVIEKENVKATNKPQTEKKVLNKHIEKNTGFKFLHSIIISNVESTNLEKYRTEFSKFGKIYNIYHEEEKRIIYVKYDNKESCTNAINAMNNKTIDGDTITVTMGKKMMDRRNVKQNYNANNNKTLQPYRSMNYPSYPQGNFQTFSNFQNFPPHNTRVSPIPHHPIHLSGNVNHSYLNNFHNNYYDRAVLQANQSRKTFPNKEQDNVIIVTNVPSNLSTEEVFAAFRETGHIMDVQILTSTSIKNKGSGIAMIQYNKAEEALAAVQVYDGGYLNNRRIRVFYDCR